MRATVSEVALIGLAIFVALDAFALLALGKASAEPFTRAWWSEWFPAGVVWLVLLGVGGARWLGKRSRSGA